MIGAAIVLGLLVAAGVLVSARRWSVQERARLARAAWWRRQRTLLVFEAALGMRVKHPRDFAKWLEVST